MSNSNKQDKKRKGSARQRAFQKSLLLKQSTASRAAGNQETKVSPGCELLSLCSSLEELLFTDFLKCSCDKDYSCLIRTGKPTGDELATAWVVLVSKYNVLTASKDAEKAIAESAKIERLNTKITVVTNLVEAARLAPDDLLIAELREWGYPYAFTPVSMEKDLSKVLAKLGNEKTRLALAVKTYEEERPKNTDDGAITRQMYMKTLYAIEEKKKMEFDLSVLTTYKFAVLYNELIEYNNHLKSKYSGNGK